MTFLQEKKNLLFFIIWPLTASFIFNITKKSWAFEGNICNLSVSETEFFFLLNHPSTPKPSTNQRAILLACLLLPSVGAVMNYQVKASTAYLPADFLWFQLSFQQLERCDLRIWPSSDRNLSQVSKKLWVVLWVCLCTLFIFFWWKLCSSVMSNVRRSL